MSILRYYITSRKTNVFNDLYLQLHLILSSPITFLGPTTHLVMLTFALYDVSSIYALPIHSTRVHYNNHCCRCFDYRDCWFSPNRWPYHRRRPSNASRSASLSTSATYTAPWCTVWSAPSRIVITAPKRSSRPQPAFSPRVCSRGPCWVRQEREG